MVLAAFNDMPRLLLNVISAVTNKVPPLRINEFAITEPGTAPKLPSAEIDSVPPEMVVAPVKVLLPERIQVPIPSLVTVPDVVPMMELMDPPCAPPRVRARVAPVIVPTFVKAMVPVPPTIELALPKVTRPA